MGSGTSRRDVCEKGVAHANKTKGRRFTVEQIVEEPNTHSLRRISEMRERLFGIPPETIKDSLELGFEVPTFFVILGEIFDREIGLSKAEFEFPIYFNYFVKKRRVKLITDDALETRIRSAFQETLFGPEWLRLEPETISQDYPADTAADALPRVFEEGVALDSARETMTIESLVDFVTWTNGRGAQLWPDDEHTTDKGVKIKSVTKPRKEGGTPVNFFEVYNTNNKKVAARVPHTVVLAGSGITSPLDPTQGISPLSSVSGSARAHRLCSRHRAYSVALEKVKPFDIPEFGVTMLGTSHGFDKDGTTTGFVLWINRRGIMIDPPPHASIFLERMCIPPGSIGGVILTHCHADHDAGTFQKLLRNRKVNLFTTRTIRDSFIRKYASITGFDEDFLNILYRFHPVTIGDKMPLYGGELRFFYSLHTIPCLGLEAFYGGESLVYSGDTHTNPSLVENMARCGAIGKARAEALSNFPFDHTVVFHEMGVAPIHTTAEELRKACKANRRHARHGPLKGRLFVMHAAAGNGSSEGFMQANDFDTVRISVKSPRRSESSLIREKLGLLRSIPWLRLVEAERLANANFTALAERCKFKVYEENDIILAQGSATDELIVIAAGTAVASQPEDAWGDSEKSEAAADAGGSHGLDLAYLPDGRIVLGTRAQLRQLFVQDCIGERGLKVALAKLVHGGENHDPHRPTTDKGVGAWVPPFSLMAQTRQLWLLHVKIVDIIQWLSEIDALSITHATLEEMYGNGNDPKVVALENCVELYNILTDPVDHKCLHYFRGLLKPRSFQKGAVLNQKGADFMHTFLIVKGRVVVQVEDTTFRGFNIAREAATEVGAYTFIADVNNLCKGKPSCLQCEAVTDVECFTISKTDLLQFTTDYPGVLLQLLDRYTFPRLNKHNPDHKRVPPPESSGDGTS